jgi:predicted nucleotidyltransferase
MNQAEMLPDGLAEIVEAKLPAVQALCRCFGVRRLDLFGSAATGRFDPERSDLDFLVEFEPMPPSPYAKACRQLQEGLERLFGRPVDLLTEPSLVNPYLRRQIEAEKRTLYSAR